MEDASPPTDGAGLFRRATRNPTRRTVLGTVAAAGVAGAAGVLGNVWTDSRDHVEVVYALARDPSSKSAGVTPREKRVSRTWAANVRLAFEAKRRILAGDVPGLVGAFVVPPDDETGVATVALESTTSGIRAKLPDDVDRAGLEIDVEEIDLPPWDGESDLPEGLRTVENLDASRIPGGVLCGHGDVRGTLAPALFDDDGTPLLATSNHVFGAEGTKRTEHAGARLDVYQDGIGAVVGAVRRGYPGEDVVVADPAPGRTPVSRIDGAVPSTVSGQYTMIGLADLRTRGEKLRKVGARTGVTDGEIEGVDGFTCYYGDVCKRGQLKWGTESTIRDGDSGSVNYHPDPERPETGVLVGGFDNARTWWPGANNAWGTAAYHLHRRYGFHF